VGMAAGTGRGWMAPSPLRLTLTLGWLRREWRLVATLIARRSQAPRQLGHSVDIGLCDRCVVITLRQAEYKLHHEVAEAQLNGGGIEQNFLTSNWLVRIRGSTLCRDQRSAEGSSERVNLLLINRVMPLIANRFRTSSRVSFGSNMVRRVPSAA
jgi:hypothetical protein